MSTWQVRRGDCLELMAAMKDASIDAIVTDPPYGIGFMGHEWDQPGEHAAVRANGTPAPYAGGRAYPGAHITGGQRRSRHPAPSGYDQVADAKRVGAGTRTGAMNAGRYDLSAEANRRFQEWCEAWGRECLRVLKPGGHLLCCGAPRTHHRLMAGIEDAGFEIRDALMAWLFGSGFPKSRDPLLAMLRLPRSTPRERWYRWYRIARQGGTALKPGHEPIVLARKPLAGTVAENVLQHDTGTINIAGCSIDIDDRVAYERNHSGDRGHAGTRGRGAAGATDFRMGGASAGAARWPSNVLLDEAAAEVLDEQSGELKSGANPTHRGSDKFRSVYGDFAGQEQCAQHRGADVGGASRFFYCAKASTAERGAANDHPTVKPLDLTCWLVRLITPPDGTVLDPFTGSGTTGIAALREGFSFIGIEREAGYCELARQRICDDSPLMNSVSEVVAA